MGRPNHGQNAQRNNNDNPNTGNKENPNNNSSSENGLAGQQGVIQTELEAQLIADEAALDIKDAAEYASKVIGADYGKSLDNQFMLELRQQIAVEKADQTRQFQGRIGNAINAMTARELAKNKAIEEANFGALTPGLSQRPTNSWRESLTAIPERVNLADEFKLNEDGKTMTTIDTSVSSSSRPRH